MRIIEASEDLEKKFSNKMPELAMENGERMGIEIGMSCAEFRSTQNALGGVWQDLVDQGDVNAADIAGVLQRSEYASWLNPIAQSDTYYIYAISVKSKFRGKRVGYHLMERAISAPREEGFAKRQFAVLPDNPAVDVYRSVGFDLLAETRAPKPTAFGILPEYRMGMVL